MANIPLNLYIAFPLSFSSSTIQALNISKFKSPSASSSTVLTFIWPFVAYLAGTFDQSGFAEARVMMVSGILFLSKALMPSTLSMDTCACVCVYVCMYACKYVHALVKSADAWCFVYGYLRMCVYVCMHVSMYMLWSKVLIPSALVCWRLRMDMPSRICLSTHLRTCSLFSLDIVHEYIYIYMPLCMYMEM